MKRILFTLYLSILTIISFAQTPTFTLSEEKPTFPNQFVTINTDGLTMENNYKKIIDWINITYDDPSQVIKAQLEDKYIRIQATSKDIAITNLLIRYFIEFRFENNNVIIDVVELELYTRLGRNTNGDDVGTWSDLSMENKKMYKKNGKPKKAYQKKALGIMNYFDEIVLSIDSHIKNKN